MAALACVLALVGSACTAQEESRDGPSPAAYATTECPPDVSAVVLLDVTCGFLSVPEDRAHPGATVKVFVTRITPPEVVSDDPMFVPGTDLGQLPNYAGIAPLAQKVGREVILMDPRGVGHSEPALECSETARGRLAVWEHGGDDPHVRSAFLDSVAACHDRWTAAGVDPSHYVLSEVAADAEDLRRELGIAEWNVITFGTASRITFAMLDRAPDRLRSVVLDSPEMPGTDPLLTAVTGTSEAVGAVLDACSADHYCARAYPDGRRTLARVLARLDRKPQVLAVPDQMRAGATTRVRMDGATFIRLLRTVLSNGGSSGSLFLPGALPALVQIAGEGRLDQLGASLSPMLAGDDPYCMGYLPKCLVHHRPTVGAVYSVLCHDIEPGVDTSAVEQAAAGRPGYAEAYGASPYRDVCASWPTAGPGGRTGLDTDVPILAFTGPYAAFSRPDDVRRGLSGASDATVVDEALGGHNMMSDPCLVSLRNAWVDQLEVTAGDRACMSSMSVQWILDEDLITSSPGAG